MEKFSYSKVETYNKCPFRYRLHYVDGHYIFNSTVATEFGTLIHYIEEHIGKDLKEGLPIDYDKYLTILFKGNDEVVGANALKLKYSNDWDVKNKSDMSYEDKLNVYASHGIYRLENYLKENPNLHVYATELKIKFEYKNKIFDGSIDRVFYDSVNNEYIIEDIKTYTEKLTPKELRTSLQMFVYTRALRDSLSIFEEGTVIKCAYDLPLIDIRQVSKIDETEIAQSLDESFTGIQNKDFHPIPTPLCHWCEYCNTNPNQPEEGRDLCPYYSKWTRENKTKEVENRWQGEDKHEYIMESWKRKRGEVKHDEPRKQNGESREGRSWIKFR